MSRTWRNERTTPKKPQRKGTQRPRMSEFAQDHYEGKGYTVKAPKREAKAYLEADA